MLELVQMDQVNTHLDNLPLPVNEQSGQVDDSDQALVQAAKADPEKFTTLYDKYVDRIYRYFVLRTSHKETAEDLTSQTFLQAFNAFGRFQLTSASFGSYLFTIAHNLLVNNYRKTPTYSLELAEELPDGSNIEKQTDLTLAWQKARSLINQLAERDREIVTMRSVDDLSFAQIGEILGLNEGAARTAYHRAVQKLIDTSKYV